ncbi:butyrophilin subfamily 2 member A1-like [Alosa pseudoharengus]|uniref:butyrophilin subfamily 2 member A1-like n=1 Tax=Alosa pseudoharengus TaxID=34774 RepID=UPI003F8902F2
MCLIGLQIVVCLHLTSLATAGMTFLTLGSNATVLLGGSATLPCWLSPTTDAEGMEVRWYRGDNKMPVLHYRDHKLQRSPLMEKYLNRTVFMPREPLGGLNQGDVSLRINNVSLNDAGTYVCYVRSSEHDDSHTLFLKVEVFGAPPILSLSRLEDDRMNVSCMSTGWHPAPQLQWSLGAQQALKPGRPPHSWGDDGLFTVLSWVVIPSSESRWISCSVFLPSRKEDPKEARVDVKSNSPAADSGRSSWMIAFIIALLAIIALTAFLLYLKMKKKEATANIPLGTEEEGNALLKEEVDFMWCEAPEHTYSEDMKKLAVDIVVNKDAAPACLKVGKDGKMMRESGDPATDYELCVLGSPGFSSGQHYWEVGLKRENTEVKKFWWVGVATDSAVQMMREQKSMPTSGLWCLYSDDKHGVHTKSASSDYISMATRPEVVGIFLDYDNGWLSFYDTKLGRHLVTIKSCFREMVHPLFNPGQGDAAALDILSFPVATPEQQPLLRDDAV